MTSLPLHPAVVHVPLGLAFVIPLLAAGFAWALWTGRIRSRGWVTIVALQALLVGAGLIAMNTGEREEDRVEAIVPEAALERHEAYAEQFLWAAGLTLALAALVLVVRRPPVARAVAVATVLGSVIVAGTAVQLGHAGGELVYVHNAGAAYRPAGAGRVGPAEGAASNSPQAESRRRRRHDDEN